jgi:peptide/nickel transport system substrate-binding protein
MSKAARLRFTSFSRAMLAIALLAITAGCSRHETPTSKTVTVVIESSPATLDPRIATDAQGARIAALIFDPLVRKDEHFNLQPALATSWEQPDPLTLVFHLRSGVKFHDGRALTSADVKWTLDSMLRGIVVSAKTGHLRAIESIDTPDAMTVVLHLSHPDANLLWNLTDGLNGIVPNGSKRELTENPVGTGPFAFVNQADDRNVVVRANTSYWGTKPKIDGAEFVVVPDETTRALELEKGTVDIAINSLTADTVNALENDPTLAIDVSPGTILNYINLNVERGPLRERKVRQAIACAIDRPAILHALFRDRARLATSLLPPGHWARADETVEYTHDVARARRLLDSAGYRPDARGVRLRLTLKTSTEETSRLLAAIVQQQLREAGIELTLRSYEFATFFGDITHGGFEMYALRWIGSNEDPDIFRATLASSNFPPKGDNRGHYANAEVDALLANAAAAEDQQHRLDDYVRVQKILAEDVPEINLWYLDNVVVHSRRLKNLQTTPSGGYEFLTTAEFATK